MSGDERRRMQLFDALSTAIGREATETLFESLTPWGEDPATARQLAEVEQGIDGRLARMEERWDARTSSMEERWDARISGLEERWDGQIALMDQRLLGLRDELLAAFRGELVAAVSGQTRAFVVATATAVFGIGGLAVTLSRFLWRRDRQEVALFEGNDD